MGMFDTIYCHVPLPGSHPFNSETDFQTKALDSTMDTFVIEEDGRLTMLDGYYEEVPEAERPYPNAEGILACAGRMRFVHTGWTFMDVSQRIRFYRNAGHMWYEFEAVFEHGYLETLILLKMQTLAELRGFV